MTPAKRTVASLAVLLVLTTTACAQTNPHPASSYIGKPVSILNGTSGPRSIGEFELHVDGQRSLGPGISAGAKIILALCATSADVSKAEQTNVGYLRAGRITKAIEKRAEAGDFLDQVDCAGRLRYHS